MLRDIAGVYQPKHRRDDALHILLNGLIVDGSTVGCQLYVLPDSSHSSNGVDKRAIQGVHYSVSLSTIAVRPRLAMRGLDLSGQRVGFPHQSALPQASRGKGLRRPCPSCSRAGPVPCHYAEKKQMPKLLSNLIAPKGISSQTSA